MRCTVPGAAPVSDGVDDHDELEPVPRVEQPGRLLEAVEHRGARRAEAVGDERADRVVPAVAAAEAGRRPHTRSTSSFRKCVAQEMQGS